MVPVTTVVRTVLGDVEPGALGATDYHEHLFQVSPLLPDDELDDEAASATEAADLLASGAGAMVEATPWGLGRRPDAVARISRATGLRVVHVTGVHRAAHYRGRDDVLGSTVADLADRFDRELVHGMDGSPVRAGAVKLGVGYWSLEPFERRAVEAVGEVVARRGVPVMVHLEHGSAAHEVLDLLAAAGCPADRVALAHVDRNPDPGLHVELAARGCFLGYDGAARHQRWPDSVLLDCLARVVSAGAGGQVLLGGDVARRSRYVAYGGMPGLRYLFSRFVPRLRALVGDDATDTVLRATPARWLGWPAPAPDPHHHP